MDQDNIEKSIYIDKTKPILEFSVVKMFIVNLISLIKNKVSLAKNFNISPSEIDRMYYWEYEYMLETVNDQIKKENENAEKERKQYGDMNPNRMMSKAKSSIPKMPSFGTPKIPSFGH